PRRGRTRRLRRAAVPRPARRLPAGRSAGSRGWGVLCAAAASPPAPLPGPVGTLRTRSPGRRGRRHVVAALVGRAWVRWGRSVRTGSPGRRRRTARDGKLCGGRGRKGLGDVGAGGEVAAVGADRFGRLQDGRG